MDRTTSTFRTKEGLPLRVTFNPEEDCLQIYLPYTGMEEAILSSILRDLLPYVEQECSNLQTVTMRSDNPAFQAKWKRCQGVLSRARTVLKANANRPGRPPVP